MAMPSRISVGPGVRRTILSATSVNIAPPSADGSNMDEGCSPIMPRIRCGTISPTNPTTPDTATEAPTDKPTPTTITQRNWFRLTPMLRAPSSPSVRASSARPVVSNSAAPMAINGRALTTSSISRSVKAPINQLMISLAAKGLGAMLIRKAVSDPASVDNTIPPRMKPNGPPPRASVSSSRILTPAPSMAQLNRPRGSVLRPRNIAVTPPRAALEETPRTVGSARGLRK